MGNLAKKKLAVSAFILLCFLGFIAYNYLWGFLSSSVQPKPEFRLSADPETVFLKSWEGAYNISIIKIESLNGFSGTVDLEIVFVYLIGDVKVTLNSTRETLQPGGEAYVLLSFSVSAPIAPGTYKVNIVGRSGDLEHIVQVTVQVKTAP